MAVFPASLLLAMFVKLDRKGNAQLGEKSRYQAGGGEVSFVEMLAGVD